MKRFSLKILAIILAITTLTATSSTTIVALNSTDAIGDFLSEGRETVTVTDAKIVANYYGFISNKEAAVLNCQAIVGNSHVIPVPADSDNLVSIDAENQTVTAYTFTSGDYTWKPVTAHLVYTDSANTEMRLEIALDESGKGSFDTELQSYSVEVDYEVSVAIDADDQRVLVNAPAILASGLANLNLAASEEDRLAGIADEHVFPSLMMLTREVNGGRVFRTDSEGYRVLKELEANRDANGGTFSLNKAIKAYLASENKVEYLINNGAEFKAAFAETAEDIITLSAELDGAMDVIEFAHRFGQIDDQTFINIGEGQGIIAALAATLSAVSDEYWEDAKNVVKSDATELELTALDLAVNAALSENGLTVLVNSHNEEALVDAPVAETVTLKAGVAQSMVNVTVNAQVIGSASINSNQLSTLSGKTASFLMKDGATEEEINAKIESIGICADALAHWTKNAATYNIDSEFYAPETVYAYDEVTGQTNVTITYVPVTFTINAEYAEIATVYYGYKLKLESHSDASKSYDYKVNGVAKYQGDVIAVAENLEITRKEGAALKSTVIPSMIASSSVGAVLSEEARAILKVNAFKATEFENLFGTLKHRVPTVATFTATEEENGYEVSAPSMTSGLLSGAVWNAVSVDLISESGEILASFPISDGVAEITFAEPFANAKINFELTVTDIETGDARIIANLPHDLATDAKEQLTILDRMTGSLYSALSGINGQTLSLINTVVGASDMSDEAKASVSAIKSCVDADNNILIYKYLTEYIAAKGNNNAEGLKYYYTANNAANIKTQLEILSGVFNALNSDTPSAVEGKTNKDVFTELLEGNGLGHYGEKLDSISEAINDCKDIPDVNSYVDRYSSSLGALTTAIYNAIDKTEAYSGNGVVTYSNSVLCAAPDKATVNIVINVVKGDGTIDSYTDSVTLANGTLIGDTIKNKFDALDALVKINKNYYTAEGLDTIPTGNVSINAVASEIVVTYTPFTYTVKVPNSPDQTFSYDSDWSITLPAAPSNSVKLVYTVGDTKVEVLQEPVVFTFKSLDILDEGFEITVEEFDLEQEKLLNFIGIMNDALAVAGARIIPVQDEQGNIILVFRVSSNISSAISSDVLTNLPMALAMYEDVQLGNNLFWDGTQVHLQAMTDMVASSGFNLELFCNTINEDGSVNNDAALSKLEPMIDAKGNIGGRLMASTMTLDGVTMSFYVTLSDETSPSMLAKMRGAVVKVKDYVNIVCEDGKFQFVITAPDAIYPYYLAQMLVSGNVDITDISALNLRDSIKYEWSLIKGILNDEDLSVETLENTFAMLGKEIDLSKYEGIFNNFKKVHSYLKNNTKVEAYDIASDMYSGTFKIDLNSVFNKVASKFNLNDTVMSLIHEADPEAAPFEIDFQVKLKNIIDKDYDAIVFDIKGEGITKKFFCTNDLADTLNNVGNYAIIILTSDVVLKKDVYIPQNAIIDLNGFTLEGNLSTGGTVRIVDSRFSTEEAGTFDGSFGKGDFVLTGGKYTSDISAFLKNGYYVNENGYVCNKLYTLKKTGNDLEIALSAGYLNDSTIFDAPALLLDIAVDVAMTAYSGSAIAIDGNYIYSFAAEDITAILGGGKSAVVNSIIDVLDTEGFSTVLNSVVNKITDFGALANAINNNAALVEYELSIENWDIVPYIADGNYITFDSVPSNKETGKFTVVISGSDEEKAALAALCNDLSVIDTEKFEINVNDIAYDNGFSVDYNGDVKVNINLTKNPAYAALICAAAAYNTNNSAKKVAYTTALEDYLNGENNDGILDTIEIMTVAEFISVFKAINNISCEYLLSSIGIDINNQTNEMIRLFNSYDNLIKIGNKLIAKLDIEGNSRTLENNKVDGTYATYRFDTKIGNIAVMLTITTVPQPDAVIIDKPHIDVTDEVIKETVKGFAHIDNFTNSEGNEVPAFAIDASVDGVSVEDFINMLTIDVQGHIGDVTTVIYDVNGNAKGENDAVGTGDTITITAFNGETYVTEEHIIIVIGDTNGDGCIDIGDSVRISAHFMDELDEEHKLTDAQIKAADTNGNGEIDIGDSVRISYKFQNWSDYKSKYNFASSDDSSNN